MPCKDKRILTNKANTYKINNSWYFVSEQSDSRDSHPVLETWPVMKIIQKDEFQVDILILSDATHLSFEISNTEGL